MALVNFYHLEAFFYFCFRYYFLLEAAEAARAIAAGRIR
jgi:hypothetical protein